MTLIALAVTLLRSLGPPAICLALLGPPALGRAQSLEPDNEVRVWIEAGRAVASGPLSGRRDIPLDAQETIVWTAAKGINALVITSRRLLGFSSRTLTWSETGRDVRDKILERRVLPAFGLVRTDTRLYGFRGANGIWFEDALGVREKVDRMHSNTYGAVIATNERVIGFGPLLGEFSSIPLGVHERIAQVDNAQGLITVTTTRRTLVFGSRMSGWDEFE